MKQKEKAIEYYLENCDDKVSIVLLGRTIDIALKEQQKESDELMESVKNVLEAIDESKRVDALFELKNLYKAILKRTK